MPQGQVSEDLITPSMLADPYPLYDRLRGGSPVRYLYIPNGALANCPDPMHAWAVMRHDEANAVLRDHATFSSQRPLAGRMMSKLVLLQDDPPRHTDFRRLVHKEFMPRRLVTLEPDIERISTGLLEEAQSENSDFIAGVAAPLPLQVIASLLGLPEDRHETYRRWANTALSVLATDPDRKSRDRAEMEAFFREQIADGRRGNRSDRLIDRIARGSRDDAPLADWEIVGFCILLLVAGSETTSHLLGNTFGLLARRPDLWDLLRKERSLVGPLVDEMLRFESPLQRMSRTATRDVEIGGARIAAGDTVVAFIGAANRDPQKFDHPSEIRFDRPGADGLAFGSGIHHCLGTYLAKMEARIALNVALDRYTELTVGPGPCARQTSKLLVFGYDTLSLRFRA